LRSRRASRAELSGRQCPLQADVQKVDRLSSDS
jgi:hypothetical protein